MIFIKFSEFDESWQNHYYCISIATSRKISVIVDFIECIDFNIMALLQSLLLVHLDEIIMTFPCQDEAIWQQGNITNQYYPPHERLNRVEISLF